MQSYTFFIIQELAHEHDNIFYTIDSCKLETNQFLKV